MSIYCKKFKLSLIPHIKYSRIQTSIIFQKICSYFFHTIFLSKRYDISPKIISLFEEHQKGTPYYAKRKITQIDS